MQTRQVDHLITAADTLLETGKLTEHREGRPPTERPFEIRLLGPEHLDEVCETQQRIVETLMDPEFYHPNPRELIGMSLGEHGKGIGTFVDGALVGFRLILFPGARADNLGRDIGLPTHCLDSVAHLERTGVDPVYRGNRLQIRMTAHAVRLIVKNHRWRHIFSTVAPANFASMQDKFRIGMQIVRTLKKYGDCWRHVFYLDLSEPVGIDPETIVAVAAGDLVAQHSLVEERGYIGFALAKPGVAPVVLYAWPSRPVGRCCLSIATRDGGH